MKRIVPDPKQMEAYLNRGLTQAQIVEEYENDTGIRCSRSAIAMAMDRYGLKGKRVRPRYMDMLPWRVAHEHRMHNDARMLRLEAKRRRGEALKTAELRWLTAWLDELDRKNVVIDYNPRSKRGFWWLPRTDEDTDIIRRPKEKTPQPVD